MLKHLKLKTKEGQAYLDRFDPKKHPTKLKLAVKFSELCKCEGKAPHQHELDTEGKLKAGGATIYSDLAPDDNQLNYSKEGWKCKRTFKIDGVTITGNGAGTLWDAAFTSGYVPTRGTPHPYITSAVIAAYLGYSLPANVVFAADVITVTPLSSTQILVSVEYSILNGATQEPSAANNTAAALLEIASSVQNQQTNQCILGDPPNAAPIICSYGGATAASGAYDIKDNNGNFVYGAPGGTSAGTPAQAISYGTAEIQNPNTLITFKRRETVPDDGAYIMACTNSKTWVINGSTYDPGSLLCIRCENETPDEGVSDLVTRQFQVKDGTAEVAASGTPGTPGYLPAQPAIPGWQVGCFFTVQSGYASVVATTPPAGTLANTQVAQAGQIPPDAQANVFQIYDAVDFSTLHLN